MRRAGGASFFLPTDYWDLHRFVSIHKMRWLRHFICLVSIEIRVNPANPWADIQLLACKNCIRYFFRE